MWKARDLLEKAKKDYVKGWEETKDFVPETRVGFEFSKKSGSKILVTESLDKLEIYLITRGFEETNNKILLRKKDIEKIYGSKAENEMKLHFIDGNYVLSKNLKEGWFETLSVLQGRKPMPIELFCVDRIFLRDSLKEHFQFSIAIMDEKISFQEGVEFIDKMFYDMAFPKHYFLKKRPQDISFCKDLQENMVMDYKGRQEKIGEVGMLSPISLSAYGIEYPVFVATLDLGALAMIKQILQNEQAATFPQFWNKLKLSDSEIADMITLIKAPEKEVGKFIASSIEKCVGQNWNKMGPARFKAYDRMIKGKRLQIYIIQPEKRKLAGKDAFNEVIVYNGEVFNLPKIPTDGNTNEILIKGKRTGINFVSAFANSVTTKIENMQTDYEIVENIFVDDYSNININVPTEVKKFVASNGNKIKVDADLNLRVEISFN